MSLRSEIDAQVAELTAAGLVNVSARLSKLQPPCIWVALDELDHFNVGGDLKLGLFIIPGGEDEYAALDAAGDTLAHLLDVVSPADVTRPAAVRLPSIPTPQAALRVTVTRPVDLSPQED